MRAAAGEAVLPQQADEIGVKLWVKQIRRVPAFISCAAVAQSVEADFVAIADQYKLAARQVVGIFPRLLHGAFEPAGHQSV